MLAKTVAATVDYSAPAGLSARAAALWASIVPSRGLTPGRLTVIDESLARP